MAAEKQISIDGVELWIEFNDLAAVGEDAQVRVFSKNAVGRKVWVKVYNRAGDRIFEKPLRKQADPPPPTVWTEELDLSIPGIPIYIERSGPLARWMERREQEGLSRREMEALTGRKLDDIVIGYPEHGVSFKAQVWS